MSAKNKKRVNPKRLKQLRAEQRNSFLKRIKKLCVIIAGENVYELIPQKELNHLYHRRINSFKIKAYNENAINSDKLKEMRAMLLYVLNKNTVDITGNGHLLCLYETFTTVFSFYHYIHTLKENDFKTAADLKHTIESVVDCEEIMNQALEVLIINILSVGLLVSALGKLLYLPKHSFIMHKSKFNSTIENLITIYSCEPESTYVTIQGIPRKIIRTCWISFSKDVKNIDIKPSILGIPSYTNAENIPVYIQPHAINRLTERIDCLNEFWIQEGLFNSLTDSEVHMRTDGTYLFDYFNNGIKTGYLIADLCEGKLVIRTFLFITQRGTPEGQRLARICGLCKLDIKYLAMDKLSSFMTPGLGKFKEIQNLFRESGCESLLQAYEKLNPICHYRNDKSIVSDIINYIGLNKGELYSPNLSYSSNNN